MKEGKSKKNKEQNLFLSTEISDPSLRPWATFAKNNSVKPPKNFNEDLWQSFENRKRKTFIRTFAAAASIILLLSIYFFTQKQKELSYKEKEALLNQAINMVDNSEVNQDIIYENEMLIIFTTNE